MTDSETKCHYTKSYYDRTKDENIQYKCPFSAEANVTTCCFHSYGQHAQYRNTKIKKLGKLLKEATNELECVGFELSQLEFNAILETEVKFNKVLFNYSKFVDELRPSVKSISLNWDFTEASFEKLDFSNLKFSGIIYFDSANFGSDSNFSKTEFDNVTRFNSSKFSSNDTKNSSLIDFSDTKFSSVDFSEASFDFEVKFFNTIFESTSVRFSKANFKKITFWPSKVHHMNFSRATFDGKTLISGVTQIGDRGEPLLTIGGEASFHNTNFNCETQIDGIFHCDVKFSMAAFNNKTELNFICYGDANFSNAQFNGKIDFGVSKFYNVVNFSNSVFRQSQIFSYMTFHGMVKFYETTFEQEGNLRISCVP